MKKILFAAVIALASVPVCSQSVSVYGVMDVSLQNNKTHGGTRDYATSSQLRSNGSLLGFRGHEALSAGNSVDFQLETSVNSLGNERGQTSANNGTAFGTLRDSFVGINLDDLGSIRGGYMSTPYRSAMVSMEIFPGAGIDLTPSTRATGVQYSLPRNRNNIHGSVSFSGNNSPTNQAPTTTATDRVISANLGWHRENFRAIAAVQQTDFVQGATGRKYPVQQATNYMVGANYTGVANTRLSAIYGHNQYRTFDGQRGDNNTIWLGASYRQGNHEPRISWARSSSIQGVTNAERSDITQLTAGYAYHLSRRTQVYGVYTRASTGSDTAYNFVNSPVASVNTIYALGDATYLQAWGVGIRHQF